MSRPARQQAPGVVKVRLSGDRADIDAVTAMLTDACEAARSAPCATP
jgi:hypothetical protein